MKGKRSTAERDNSIPEEHEGRPFQLKRSAAVAIGVVVFLFVFRPFGLTVDSVAEALMLLAIAPLNILIMFGIHILTFRLKSWRTAFALFCLLVGNTAYLAVWSQSARALEIGFSVALVVGMTAVIVTLWNRGRIPEQELLDSEHLDSEGHEPVTLTGDGAQEVMRLTPGEILFMSASGNYVDVHYRSSEGVTTSMFRSSLARLASQVPGNLMIQCHRSYFVNLSAARRIVRSKGRTLVEFDQGQRVPVSRKFRQDVLREIST